MESYSQSLVSLDQSAALDGTSRSVDNNISNQPVFPQQFVQRKHLLFQQVHTKDITVIKPKEEKEDESGPSLRKPDKDFAETEHCVKREWPLDHGALSERDKLEETNLGKHPQPEAVDGGLVIKLEPDSDSEADHGVQGTDDRSRDPTTSDTISPVTTARLSEVAAADCVATLDIQGDAQQTVSAVPLKLYHNHHHPSKLKAGSKLKAAHLKMTQALHRSGNCKKVTGHHNTDDSSIPSHSPATPDTKKNRRKRCAEKGTVVLSSSLKKTEDCTAESTSSLSVISKPPPHSLPSQPTQALVDQSRDELAAEDSSDTMDTDSPVTSTAAKSKGKHPTRFVCKDCGMGFRWQSRFDEHQRKHSGERPFMCRECGDAFSSSSYLRVHQRKHSGLYPYSCTICGQEFMHGRHLTAHRKLHAEEGAFTCQDCNLKCCNPGELSRHRQTEHPDDASNKPYVCNLCPAAFQRIYHLETHMRSHTGEKPFLCKLCGQSYSTQGSLKVHTRSHTGEKPFKCSECERAFVTSGQLKKHSRTHNKPIVTLSEDNKTIFVQTLKPVPQAEEGSKSGGRGRRRKRSSAAEAPSTLTLEIQSYPADRAYSCDLCGAVFVRSCDLASHIRHDHPASTKKDKVCRECGTHFSRTHTLKVHRRTHSGTKPYECDTCHKQFAQRSNLTAHLRTHSQPKPYRCPVCGVGYSSAKYRQTHVQRHGEMRPCVCTVCGSSFSSADLLSTHLRSHERGETTSAGVAPETAQPADSLGLDEGGSQRVKMEGGSQRVKMEPFDSEGDGAWGGCGDKPVHAENLKLEPPQQEEEKSVSGEQLGNTGVDGRDVPVDENSFKLEPSLPEYTATSDTAWGDSSRAGGRPGQTLQCCAKTEDVRADEEVRGNERGHVVSDVVSLDEGSSTNLHGTEG